MVGFRLLIVVVLCCATLPAAPATEPGAAPPGRKHALLIGCTAYPALGRRHQLRGPGNDVALTLELLRDRFDFAAGAVVTLVHDNDPPLRPTHDNIVREFEALIGRVQRGDDVFILLGGHGSQQRDDNPGDPADAEPDGLDEVFLPEDVTEWKLNQPVVKAIRDDQIRAWLDAIRARGAFVFFVADTCHSGTIDRGLPDENEEDEPFYRERHVDARLINPPDDLAGRSDESALTSSRTGAGDVASAADGDAGGLVALYAVDDRTLEREHPMPPDNRRDGPSYGRLSYALNWVLARSRRPLTYRELAQQIRWRYEGWQWDNLGFMLGAPAELDREVLGAGSWQDRSTVTLARDEFGRLSINVGALHGATAGSVYLVYPPAGRAGDEAAVGAVRVVEATPASARVEPCAFEQLAAATSDELPAPGRCELAFAAASATTLAVGVAPFQLEDPHADLSAVQSIVRELARDPSALIRLADHDEAPDAFVLVDGDNVLLRRTSDVDAPASTDVAEAVARFPGDAFGPWAIDEGSDASLAQGLRAMAKAINLRRVATSEGEMVIGDPYDPAVTLEIRVERWNDDRQAFEPVDALAPLDAYDGDKLRVSVFNRGGSAVDVTILYIESAFRIRSYFPTAAQELAGGFHNRIAPGGAPAAVEFSINDSTIGLEDVLVVATLPEPGAPPRNFVFLEQSGLSTLRGGDGPASGLNSPAGQLLARLAFGRGERGGTAAADVATFAVHRRSWTVRKRPPAAP